MSKYAMVSVDIQVVKDLVADYLSREEERFNAQLAALKERWKPLMTCRRWFGLRAPAFTNPSDEEILDYAISGSNFAKAFATLEFSLQWEEAQALAENLLELTEKSDGRGFYLSLETFNTLTR